MGPRYPPNDRLKRAREERDWTQEDVDQRLRASIKAANIKAGKKDEVGPDPNRVYKWEAGYSRPGRRFRPHLMRVFGMSAADLGLEAAARSQSRNVRQTGSDASPGSLPDRIWPRNLLAKWLARRPRRLRLLLLAVATFGVAAIVLVGIQPWTSGPSRPVQGKESVIHGKTSVTAPWVRAPDGLIEQLSSANVSAGAIDYSYSTNVSYDQFVKIQVGFFNPTSYVIYNVSPSVSLPTQPGINQAISVALSDASGTTLNQTIPLVLDDPRGELEFEPDSVKWGHLEHGNHGTPVVSLLPDRVLTNGAPLQTLLPHSSGSLTFLVREVIPGIAVDSWGHGINNPTWASSFEAPAGSKVYFKVTIQDDGDTPLTEVLVADHLPSGAQYISGSAHITYSGSSSSNSTARTLPATLIETGVVGSSVGAPLPPIPVSGYYATLLNGRPASLLPGETATITLAAKLGQAATNVTDEVDIRWQGNPAPIQQSLMING